MITTVGLALGRLLANVPISFYPIDHQKLGRAAVLAINADLTSETNLLHAQALLENRHICFQGPSAKSPLDIDTSLAEIMLAAPRNINGRTNADVVRPVAGALELVRTREQKWTIDFGLLPQEEAELYELPFEYVRKHVYPVRSQNRRAAYAVRWWQYAEPRPGMRRALAGLQRYIATPAHSKHRLFVWVAPEVLCNQATLVFARQDDYFFGVLHARPHELWSLRMGTYLGVGNDPRYTPSTTFETCPFPWPPGAEPQGAPQVEAIAAAAKRLVELRDNWLNPEGADEAVGTQHAASLRRTLTNLYNARPAWLDTAHRKLDAAVLDAYAWPHELSDEELLTRLLALNAERAVASGTVGQRAGSDHGADTEDAG